jgi:hypothetical protein
MTRLVNQQNFGVAQEMQAKKKVSSQKMCIRHTHFAAK